ncbi:MAG TPA: hypothetical protein VJ249_00845 [Candidatus Bathyarchaeia archaeon]|nr:hypothetical protein [Candidatus Bathyarchaeia archaeon]
METTMRQATRGDAQQMLQAYNNFTRQFVGSASRTIKQYRIMLRKKENINWVTLNRENRIIAYLHARIEKRLNRGEYREVVVDPEYSFDDVSRPLVEKVHAVFMEKKVSAITAGSIRNPAFQKLFSRLGFFESESTDVFMYAVLDVQKLLNELTPVFANRLKQVRNWNGLVQMECNGRSIFFQKAGENVNSVVWTNQPSDFKIKLDPSVLTKLIFGVADALECLKTGQLEVKAQSGKKQIGRLLKSLFLQKQFLIMDYW